MTEKVSSDDSAAEGTSSKTPKNLAIPGEQIPFRPSLLGMVALTVFLTVQSGDSNPLWAAGELAGGIVIDAEVPLENGANLAAGEVIRSWQNLDPPDPCGLESGEVASIFEWQILASEVLPRSPMRLTVEREKRSRDVVLAPGSRHLPVYPGEAATQDLAAELAATRQKADAADAPARWREIVGRLDGSESNLWILYQHFRQTDPFRQGQLLPEIRAELRDRWNSPFQEVLIRESFVRQWVQLEDYESGLAEAREWLAAEEARCSVSWRASLARYFVAKMLRHLEIPEDAEILVRRVVREQETFLPASVELADSLHLLGSALAMQGRTDEALNWMGRSHEMYSRLDPGSAGHVRLLTHLANLHHWLGSFAAAEELLLRAVRWLEKRPQKVDLTVGVLMESGRLAEQRGKFELARSYFLEVLELSTNGSKIDQFAARALRYLGDQAARLQDFPAAEAYYLRALEIDRDRGPFLWSATLERLGTLKHEQGDIESAIAYFEKSQEILQADYRDSSLYAGTLLYLSRLYLESGRKQASEACLDQALKIAEKAASPLLLASALRRYSDLELEKGRFERALELQVRSVGILKDSLPRASYTAFFIGHLALLAERVGDQRLASASYREAIEILDFLSLRLGYIGNTDINFRSSFRDIYRNYIDFLVETGKPEEAFATLEAVRAQSSLAVLAERNLDLWAQLPDHLQERLENHAESYDAKMRLLWQTPSLDDEAQELILADLEQILGQRETILREIRASNPDVAALRYPETLDLKATQETLDDGTLMLSFSIGEKATTLFSLTRTSFASYKIPWDEDELTRKVILLRDLIAGSRAKGIIGLHRQRQLQQVRQELFERLLGPVEETIGQASRLFIVPDGALHLLPWGILGRDRATGTRYLVEQLPIHLSSSGTVFGAIKSKSRAASNSEGLFLALADPDFPTSESDRAISTEPVLRTFLEQSPDLSPLPASRTEVHRLKEVYPQAKILVGREASEEAVKSLGNQVSYLHFATHSLLDERRPLNTAIVLAIPERFQEGRENGLLQVWEITEQLRFDAELVVLSACETALGKKIYGEGLVGLTRAFHHAGAQTIMASLWRIVDETTAELIEHFYIHLKAGASKDQALRRAQLELIHKSRTEGSGEGKVSPYHWAAFQIYGDWH